MQLPLFRENPEPTTEEEIKAYLAGNLCRCSGYEGQLRGMEAFIEYKKEKGKIMKAVGQPIMKKRRNGTGDRETGIHR